MTDEIKHGFFGSGDTIPSDAEIIASRTNDGSARVEVWYRVPIDDGGDGA